MQVTEADMPVTEFQYNSPSKLRRVVNNHEVLHVQYHRKPYVTVVPREWYERAAAALEQVETAGEVTAA